MMEHAVQLLGELGGETEGEEGEQALEEEFEPSSDDEEDDADDTAMEHWPKASHTSSCLNCPHYGSDELKFSASSETLFYSPPPHLSKMNFGLLKSGIKSCSQSVSFSELFNVFEN